MKLLRYGPRGHEKPGLLDADGNIRDLSGLLDDITPKTLAPAALAVLKAIDPTRLPKVQGSPRLAVRAQYRRRKGETKTALALSDDDFGTKDQPQHGEHDLDLGQAGQVSQQLVQLGQKLPGVHALHDNQPEINRQLQPAAPENHPGQAAFRGAGKIGAHRILHDMGSQLTQ